MVKVILHVAENDSKYRDIAPLTLPFTGGYMSCRVSKHVPKCQEIFVLYTVSCKVVIC